MFSSLACREVQQRRPPWHLRGLLSRGWASEPRSGSGLFRLDVDRPDHLVPLLRFLSYQPAEVSGRARKYSAAQIGKARLELGIGEARIDLLVELLDDHDRRGLRCTDAEPDARFVAGHKFAHGGDVRERLQTRRGGYCERAQPARLDILDG